MERKRRILGYLGIGFAAIRSIRMGALVLDQMTSPMVDQIETRELREARHQIYKLHNNKTCSKRHHGKRKLNIYFLISLDYRTYKLHFGRLGRFSTTKKEAQCIALFLEGIMFD